MRTFGLVFAGILFISLTVVGCNSGFFHKKYKLKAADVEFINIKNKNYFPSGIYEPLDSSEKTKSFPFENGNNYGRNGEHGPDQEYYFRRDRFIFNAKNIREITISKAATEQWALNIKLDQTGTEKFAVYTGSHIDKFLPVVLNNKIIMAPRIISSINGGNLEISGNATEEELEKYKAILEYERDYLRSIPRKK